MYEQIKKLADEAMALQNKDRMDAALRDISVVCGGQLADSVALGSCELKVTQRNERPVDAIARMAHEVNRAYCAAIGDDSQPAWEDAPDWQRQSAISGVMAHMEGDLTPEQSHESWMAQKAADGWIYGPVKDAEKKEHPCFLPYAELPPEQRVKDYLFRAIVQLAKGGAK
jgi:hypothetical protein